MIDLTMENDFCLKFSSQNIQKITFDFAALNMASNWLLGKFAAGHELSESGHQLAPPVGEIASCCC